MGCGQSPPEQERQFEQISSSEGVLLSWTSGGDMFDVNDFVDAEVSFDSFEGFERIISRRRSKGKKRKQLLDAGCLMLMLDGSSPILTIPFRPSRHCGKTRPGAEGRRVGPVVPAPAKLTGLSTRTPQSLRNRLPALLSATA